MPSLKFLAGERALLAGRMLIVSDLHIGIEYEYRLRGLKMPSQTHDMRARLDRLLDETNATNLLIAGDIKHKVPGTTFQEQREIPDVLEHLSQTVQVEIVQGNHDAGLRPLLPEGVVLHPATGVLKGETFLIHGHAWPSPLFLSAGYVILGHVQPHVEIRDALGYCWREPVWVRARLDRKKTAAKYGKSKTLPEIIVLPSFNRMAGGLALNKKENRRERLSPLLQLARFSAARLFLLDGTLLGSLGTIQAQRRESAQH